MSVRWKTRADQHVSPLVAGFVLLAEQAFLDEARLARNAARSEVVGLDVQLHSFDSELCEGVLACEADCATREAVTAVSREDDVGDLSLSLASTRWIPAKAPRLILVLSGEVRFEVVERVSIEDDDAV